MGRRGSQHTKKLGHFQREFANLLLYAFLQRRSTPCGILLNTQRRRPCSPRAFSPAFFQSRAAVHLFRPHLENMWLLLLQNGSRTLRWLELHLPAMLPTSRRPTGTLRQDLQSPMQWDKNVSSQPLHSLCLKFLLPTVTYYEFHQTQLLHSSLFSWAGASGCVFMMRTSSELTASRFCLHMFLNE